jgi:hypothetical protein
LATNSKTKNIRDLYRGINELKRGYQSRNNLVKDENGDLLADSHNIFNTWNKVNTTEPLVPGPSCIDIEIATAKLKKYKSPGSDQIPAELIQAGGEVLLAVIHELINSIWNKEKLSDQWKESINVPIHKKGEKIDCNNYCGISMI